MRVVMSVSIRDLLTSSDGSMVLDADIDNLEIKAGHEEHLSIDFDKIDPNVSCCMMVLDGGLKNFKCCQRIAVQCAISKTVGDTSFFVPSDIKQSSMLFEIHHKKPVMEYQAMCMFVFYRESYDVLDGTYTWACTSLLEPMYVSNSLEKIARCTQGIIKAVPNLNKYKKNVFSSTNSVCSALSSTALPKLKVSFEGPGLPIEQFTAVLYYQLCELFPQLSEFKEAAYTCAGQSILCVISWLVGWLVNLCMGDWWLYLLIILAAVQCDINNIIYKRHVTSIYQFSRICFSRSTSTVMAASTG